MQSFFEEKRKNRPEGRLVRRERVTVDIQCVQLEENGAPDVRPLWIDRAVVIHLLAVDDEAGEEEFGHKVQEHREDLDQVAVPAALVRQIPASEHGDRRKDAVVGKNLCHCHGNIGRRVEGKFPVDGEVIDHRKGQGDQMGRPPVPMQNVVHQQEGSLLDDAGRGREQRKLQGTVFFFALNCHVLAPSSSFLDYLFQKNCGML